MRTVAIIQARTGSTRFPSKVLADLAGRPMLEQVVRRVQAAPRVDDVVVATTTSADDDPVAHLADRIGVRWFRGSQHDVLGRYVGAAAESRADAVVRITADCPLLDPWVVARVVQELHEHAAVCDYAGNAVDRTYPRGLDTEALFTDTLLRVDRLAREQREREHVTMAIYATKAMLFLRRDVKAERDDGDLRWTVDHPLDLDVVAEIYRALGLGERILPYADVVDWCREHPDVTARNADLETWHPLSPTA